MKKTTTFRRSETVAFCGLAIALLTVSAWVTVPLGPVPFTLQTMALAFVILLFPPREALASVLGYVGLGAIGVPVFSGMRGGVAALLGPTGGFIVGFAIGAIAAVAMLRAWKAPRGKAASVARDFAAALVLLLTSYLCGWMQLMAVAGMGPAAAFLTGIAPFIVLDIAKIAFAVFLARAIRAAVPALRSASRKA